MSSELFIGKVGDKNRQLCTSVFRLAGKNEDALTFAMGYLLAKDPVFCLAFLKQCGVIKPMKGKQWLSLFNDYQVHLQEVTDPKVGRRDIVIELGTKIRAVLEAKIGRAVPTAKQLLKYAKEPKDWDGFDQKDGRAIVSITRDKLPKDTKEIVELELKKSGIAFYGFRWHEVYSLVQTHRRSGKELAPEWLFDEFVQFCRRDYEMKFHDAEVAIQDVDNLNAKIFREGWMYVTNKKGKAEPLYFAPYLTKTLNSKSRYASPYNGISDVSRVLHVKDVKVEDVKVEDVKDLKVEDLLRRDLSSPLEPDAEHSKKWKTGLVMIRGRAVKENWKNTDIQRLYFLDKPFELLKDPLTKKKRSPVIPNQIPKHFSLTFEQLLKQED